MNITLVIIFYTQYGSMDLELAIFFLLHEKRDLFDQLNIAEEINYDLRIILK